MDYFTAVAEIFEPCTTLPTVSTNPKGISVQPNGVIVLQRIPEGSLVYNETTRRIMIYNGLHWEDACP